MSKSLSDVARQNNSARVSKFASSIIPSAPEQDTPAVVAPAAAPAESLTEVIKQGETDFAEGKGTILAVDQLPCAAKNTEPVPVIKPGRKRTGSLSMDDITGPKPPDDEGFIKMTRIAEKHHDLLRKIAFETRKPMNTILYNWLEVLEQTYQRDQQSHA